MARGVTLRNMDRCGLRPRLHRVGLHIPMATGFGSIHGDGRGKIIPLGDLRRSTTAAGLATAAVGDGLLVRTTAVGRAVGIRRPWSLGLAAVDGVLASVSDLAAASDGAPWVGESRSTPGITADGATSAT